MFITVVTRAISVLLSHLNPLEALILVLNCTFYYNSPFIRKSKGHSPLALYAFTRFVQEVSGLELWWLFTGWDMCATSLDMFVHVLATHDTSCKWLRLLSWL